MGRKNDTIQLLHYLMEQYKNNPEIKNIRLGQLLLNVIPNETQLYYMESNELQTNIEKFLKGVKTCNED